MCAKICNDLSYHCLSYTTREQTFDVCTWPPNQFRHPELQVFLQNSFEAALQLYAETEQTNGGNSVWMTHSGANFSIMLLS